MKTMSRSVAALGLLLSAFMATSASAAIITYDFSVAPGTGPLAGHTYNGVLSYDDATVGNPGFAGFLTPTTGSLTVSFTFEGTTYTTVNDADYPTFPRVTFAGSTFQGLTFVVTNQFNIGLDPDYIGGGRDFTYIGSEPFLTLNAVTYALRTNDDGQKVAEPATLAVLGAGLFGLGMIRRRQSRTR